MGVSFTPKLTWTDHDDPSPDALVTAADYLRLEQLGADVDAWSDQVDVALHTRMMVAGRWHPASIPFIECNATTALTAGTVEMLPFEVTRSRTFDMIGCNVGTASAGSVIRLGVYATNPTLDEPGALVHDQGTTSSATTGDKMLTISGGLALPRGMYWLAMVSDGTPAVRRTAGAMSNRGRYGLFGSPGVDQPEGFSLRYTGYTATSALPNPATRAGRSARNIDIPLVWMRAA